MGTASLASSIGLIPGMRLLIESFGFTTGAQHARCRAELPLPSCIAKTFAVASSVPAVDAPLGRSGGAESAAWSTRKATQSVCPVCGKRRVKRSEIGGIVFPQALSCACNISYLSPPHSAVVWNSAGLGHRGSDAPARSRAVFAARTSVARRERPRLPRLRPTSLPSHSPCPRASLAFAAAHRNEGLE